MKILKLNIKHIRGIHNLSIEPKCKSFVIYGPNGSGKSAVIDAIDFLLTGKIARLSGEGTDGVSLKQHGPHIDMVGDLINVEVSAEILVPGITEPVAISRKMNKPNELLFETKYEAQLSPIFELLNRGQYVFTRREVLKLITAKSSTRAQEIQKVLKLNDLEDIRTNLVKVYNESKRVYNSEKDTLSKAKRDVIAITGQPVYDNSEVLKFINEQRKKLGGVEIGELEADKLQQGIAGVQANPASINHNNLVERINRLKAVEVEKIYTNIAKTNSALRKIINEVQDDSLASWNAKRYIFTKEGIRLLRATGECPLCDKVWESGQLQKYLQDRVEEQSKRQTELEENSNNIKDKANALNIRIQQVTEIVKPVVNSDNAKGSKEFTEGLRHLNEWSTSLTCLIIALADPIEKFTEGGFSSEKVSQLYTKENVNTVLEEFEYAVKKLFPEASPEQTAWDSLTKLVERIKIVEEGELSLELALKIFNRATALAQTYVKARNEILESLYDKIKNRFVGLYKEMHGEDEKGFNAAFTPQEAGLDLEVDFYGRGFHPPHAMHSEGHQDSMGVCLFLALSEHLNYGLIDLVILDDVVMSVDVGHRRAFSHVLSANFPNKQFIITTHDTTWANQLRGEGLVNRKQMLKFSDWSVEGGPRVHYAADMWTKIEEDLDQDEISAASAKLRNGLEEFTRFVCDNLHAKVPYTLDDGGSLGDFLDAAIGTHNELMEKAIRAAESWGKKEDVEALIVRKDHTKDLINSAMGEKWSINKTVHFNDWANFSKKDFEPVVRSFRELCESVFACNNEGCDSVLKVTFDGAFKNGVRCKCGKVNWNLNKK